MNSQSQALKILRQFSILALALYGLFISYQSAASAAALWDPDHPFSNPVDKWQKRINRVKQYIPADASTLGYVADWDIPGAEYNAVDQDAEYVLTQYALAPARIKPGLDEEWIIGNFTDATFKDWLDQKIKSYEISDLGFGIYVIHRTQP